MRGTRKPKSLKLTDLERQAYVGFAARYRAIEAEAQLAKEQTLADERTFVVSLAERLGVDPKAIGVSYRMNMQTWELEPVPKPPPEPKTEV